MSAALLSRAWGDADAPAITVIESPQVERVGVGESSIPALPRLLRALGIDEADWLKRCQATFKSTLHFVGWGTDPRQDYYHPLFCWGEDDPALFHDWLRASRHEGLGEPFDSCFQGVHLSRLRRAPRSEADPPYQSAVQYAYHLDAALFAEYLKEWSCRRGVRLLADHVTEIGLATDGGIGHLTTKENGRLSAEFYVDCTGFRGLLINGALGEPFVSYSDYLLNDSAIAISTFNDQPGRRTPCETKATAMDAGWEWDIPLQHRHGTGYVYSSNHLTREAAERELRAHLGDVRQSDARHIKMRVGRTRRAWVRNCLSVGLSTGFIEPLESTSIFCIQYGLAQFLLCLKQHEDETAQRDAYNESMRLVFEGIRDFVFVHFHLAEREDTPFWRDYRNNRRPDRLEAILSGWERGEDIEGLLAEHPVAALVKPCSWYCILVGNRRLPGPATVESAARRPPAGARLAERIRELGERSETYGDHTAYLARLA
jgi:tryptophan halogenase